MRRARTAFPGSKRNSCRRSGITEGAVRMGEAGRIRGVIFDMDGLMFDTERLAVEGWQKAGREFGFDISDALVIQTAGRSSADTRAVLEEGLGTAIPYKEMRKIRLAHAADVVREKGVPLKRGLSELLAFLEGRSIPRAVATSTERSRTEELLRMSRLQHRFQFLVCGDEIPRGKPAPDIFLAAARGLGVAPRFCAVLEDSESGLRAAGAAGMMPLLVPDLGEPSAAMRELAQGIFSSLDEAIEYLRRFISGR
jgi:HAD superfamily hydrolase (TIGR01509 family)